MPLSKLEIILCAHFDDSGCNFRFSTITIIAPLMKAYNQSMSLRRYTPNIGLWSVLFHNFIARGFNLNWDFFHYKHSHRSTQTRAAERPRQHAGTILRQRAWGSCALMFSYLHSVCDDCLLLHLCLLLWCQSFACMCRCGAESSFLPLQTGLWSLQAAKTSATRWQLMVLLPCRT